MALKYNYMLNTRMNGRSPCLNTCPPTLYRYCIFTALADVTVCCISGQGVDTPLSETGMQQGEAVGQYLKDITFNHVFASNLQRAVQVRQVHAQRPLTTNTCSSEA